MDRKFINVSQALLWSVKNDKKDKRDFCDHDDVLRVLETLFKNRIIDFEHINVLKHYSLRGDPPHFERFREKKAHDLWKEAMKLMRPAFEAKGIVRERLER